MAQPVRELTGRSYIWSPGADMEDFTLQLDFPLHSRLGGEPYAVKTGRSDLPVSIYLRRPRTNNWPAFRCGKSPSRAEKYPCRLAAVWN